MAPSWSPLPPGAALWQRLLALLGLALVAVLLWRLTAELGARLRTRIRGRWLASLGPFRLGGLELVPALQVRRWVHRGVGLLVGFLRLVGAYVLASAALGLFQPTAGLAGHLLDKVVEPLALFGHALVDYLPSGLVLLVVVLVTRTVLGLVKGLFDALGEGHRTAEGFDPDWARPTYTLVRLGVLAFALVLAFPYLPGAGSEAFKAIGLFVGVLVSLGGSGTIGNLLSGAILTYTRAYRVGDVVKLGEDAGVVVHRGLLTTRLRTFKQEEVVVANATVLNGKVLNYSAQARPEGPGMVLHTTVSLGYAVPWDQVHGLLLEAARRSQGILADPKPFVLQAKLDDFYVVYELNAHTREPERMPALYDELHRHIQDTFAEAGVEIMSPHVHLLRDGHGEALPGKPASKGFRMEGR
jgi:small-conductance mechanosensitive channel